MLIARRQPNFDGSYDLARHDLPDTDAQFAAYDGAYASTTKRCALWSIDPATRTFRPLVDVPGTGLVAARATEEQAVTWLVTGVDDAGVARAAASLSPTTLRDAFAVAATPSGPVRLPVEGRP